MKKVVKAITMVVTAVGVLLCLMPYAASGANNPPHVPEKGINCDSCHLPATDPIWDTIGDPDPDNNDPYNRICWICHNDASAPFKKTHSPTADQSGKYGNWRWRCPDCHNPHQQRQAQFDQYTAGLTGTIVAVNGTAKQFSLSVSLPARPGVGDATNLDDYQGWTIVPNRTYKTINYKIDTNSGNTVTVTTPINTARVPVGSQFGILPGKYIKDVIYTPGGAKYAKFLALEGPNSFVHNDGLQAAGQDSTPDGVCQVCHAIRPEGQAMAVSRADGTGFGKGHATDSASYCTGCHDHARVGLGNPGCTNCHGSPPADTPTLITKDKNGAAVASDSPGAGAHVKHVMAGFQCSNCHTGGMFSGAGTGDDLINIGFSLGGTLGGSYDGKTGRTAYPYAAGGTTSVTAAGTLQCSNIYCHSSGTSVATGVVPPNSAPAWTSSLISCSSCHGYPPGYANGSPKASSHGRHSYMTCDKCHWLTTRTGNAISDYSKHVNRIYDVGNNMGTITYSFNISGGSCSGAFGCHGNATWGSSITPPDYTDCIACHKSPMGSRRQIVDSNGDGTGTGGDFKKTSHHHYPESGTISSSDCRVCHDSSAHPGGNVRLKNADTGEVYIFSPADPATAENHCLSCHDADGAGGNMAPFSDGKVLGQVPYRGSVDIKTNWSKNYGHRRQGLTCLGSGNPGTGCHAGGHGSDHTGLLSKNLTLPNPSSAWYSASDEGSYEICFTCHQSYVRVTKEAVLGYRTGGKYDIQGDGPPPYNIPNIVTRFRDRYDESGKFYDDGGFFSVYSNLHYFHLQGGYWAYRGTMGSSINCISCHDVHGSNTQWGWLYDQLQFMHYAGEPGDQYGTMDAPDYSTFSSYPANCTFNCHELMEKTFNWYEPSGE